MMPQFATIVIVMVINSLGQWLVMDLIVLASMVLPILELEILLLSSGTLNNLHLPLDLLSMLVHNMRKQCLLVHSFHSLQQFHIFPLLLLSLYLSVSYLVPIFNRL